MREIGTCMMLLARLLFVFGAFYRDGTISIALEYMDGGSLANLVHQVGAVKSLSLLSRTRYAMGSST